MEDCAKKQSTATDSTFMNQTMSHMYARDLEQKRDLLVYEIPYVGRGRTVWRYSVFANF